MQGGETRHAEMHDHTDRRHGKQLRFLRPRRPVIPFLIQPAPRSTEVVEGNLTVG